MQKGIYDMCKSGFDYKNMFPHWKKPGMGEHKMAKNMFPTYTKRHIFEQSDIFHALGMSEHKKDSEH